MFLAITKSRIEYHSTATEAARSLRPAWDWKNLAERLLQLEAGDELDIDSNTSVIALSGKNPTL